MTINKNSAQIQVPRQSSPLKVMTIIILLPALLSVCGCSSAKQRESSSDDVAKIKALCESYRTAWLANDPKAVLNTFREDAVLLPHHGDKPVRGIAAIRNFWWPANSVPATVTSFTSTMDEVQSSGDIGYVWGSFSLSFSYEEEGRKKTASNAGTYLMIMRRQSNGEWLITHRMWDDPVPQ